MNDDNFMVFLGVAGVALFIVGAFAAINWFETKCKEKHEADYQATRKRQLAEYKRQLDDLAKPIPWDDHLNVGKLEVRHEPSAAITIDLPNGKPDDSFVMLYDGKGRLIP